MTGWLNSADASEPARRAIANGAAAATIAVDHRAARAVETMRIATMQADDLTMVHARNSVVERTSFIARSRLRI
ncbi:hypothetical protein JQ616_24415 [Bradyrhizobium tropiciagri]|uniref:hypothetical protein n=1 Tax=Bradyrhizobium tropiciagri TaxID=312253 RepID=UPI001BA599AB|nr:hypothetical protein [Bradyrhizobium tropiciagri]MBR0898114.1 hypothetical protein [Bradyrhizobium tropiciagri]